MIKEGETAKGLNYEVEDMQAAVLHQTGSQAISLSMDGMNHGQCKRTVGNHLSV